MDPKSDEYLSAEELRDRLYHSLRGRGMVDSIKTQVRNSLLTELQQSGHRPVPGHSGKHAGQESPLHRAVNSLIVDYMRRMKLDYSLSVFLPESGTATDKVLSYNEILQLLQVNPQSKLYRKLGANAQNEVNDGFLWQFLCELSALNSTPSQESCSQTDGVNLVPFSALDDKLIGLDEYYSFRRDENYRSSAMSMEERLLSYQRQLEAESRRQMKLELARFKDNDLGRLRLEEKESCRKQVENIRKEMEKTYQCKADGLAERERNTLKRLDKEQEIQSRDVYTQRQTVLSEIETVRQRESQVKRESEALQREKQLLEERIQSREEAVRRRDTELNRSQREYDQRLETDMAQFKMEEQTKFLKRSQNLDHRETKVRDEENVLKEGRLEIDRYKSEIRDKTASIHRLEMLLQETKSKEVAASCSNETLTNRLREVSDYSAMKEDNFRMKTELDTLRMQLKEMTQLYARSQTVGGGQLGSHSGGHHLLEGEITSHSPRRSQSDITTNARQVENNRELLKQFEESTLQQKEMYREMMDLRQQLHLTQQALNNEIYRKPKNAKSNVETSGHSLLGDWSEDGEGAVHTTNQCHVLPRNEDNEVYNDVDIDGEMLAPPRRLDYEGLSEDDGCQSDPASADVVAEAKYRLKSLEREAQNLEQTYRDFHYRLTNVHAVSPGTNRSAAKKSLPTFSQELSKQAEIKGPVWGGVAASPIRAVRQEDSLVSSTPCAQTRLGQDPDDSLSELTGSNGRGGKGAYRKEFPELHLSQLSDSRLPFDLPDDRDHSNLITLADLEARPGSPSVVVMAASDSSGSKQEMPSKPVQKKESEPLAPVVSSLDQIWQTGEKMDNNEEEENIKRVKEEAERQKRKAEEEEDRRWEEERRQKEETRKQKEQDEWEREQRELQKEQMKENPNSETGQSVEKSPVDEDTDGDGIDPVMKKYMAMVQQQKLQQQQQQKTDEPNNKEKSPVVSEHISTAEDVDFKSDNDSIPDFDW